MVRAVGTDRCNLGGRGIALLTIRAIAETGSTNADLLALATSGIEEGTWLRADRQTAGRGRQGRAWLSEGGNLSASTLVRLRPSDRSAPTLALVAAVALEEAVSLLFRRDGVTIKWPNDLLLNDAKFAGILLERTGDAVVIGFGANLAHAPDVPDRTVTFLAAHEAQIAPSTLVEVLAETFERWLARWRGEGIAPVRARWLARAHVPGTALSARLPDGGTLDGLFDGLDATGALILRLGGGERRVIHAGDVFLI